jgi:hypothetical protein
MAAENKKEEKDEAKGDLLWIFVRNLLQNDKLSQSDIDFEQMSVDLHIDDANNPVGAAKKRWKGLILWFESRDAEADESDSSVKVSKTSKRTTAKGKADAEPRNKIPDGGDRKSGSVEKIKKGPITLPSRRKYDPDQGKTAEDFSTDDEAAILKKTKQRKLKGKTPTIEKDPGNEASRGSKGELHGDDDVDSHDPATAVDSVENGPDAGDSEA